MSRSDLFDRYVSPLTPTTGTLVGELMRSGPDRQHHLIGIAQSQLKAQRATAAAIAASSAASAQVVAAEIERSSMALERSLQRLSGELIGAVGRAADQVSQAVEVLGDRLCAHLDELRWQAEQQTKYLEGIFYVLRNNRNNEARQFVEQGVHLLANGHDKEAEARFLKAFDEDPTDYQVLRNLGYLCLRKGLRSEAEKYFWRALEPPTLPAEYRAAVLWSLARIASVEDEHRRALELATKAAGISSESANIHYQLAIYNLHGERTAEAETHLAKAIKLNPIVVATASVDPELDAYRGIVSRVLEAEIDSALASESDWYDTVLRIDEILDTGSARGPDRVRSTIAGRIDALLRADDGSLTAVIERRDAFRQIADTHESVAELLAASEEHEKVSNLARVKQKELHEASRRLDILYPWTVGPFLAYLFPGAVLALFGAIQGLVSPLESPFIVLMWPLGLLASGCTAPDEGEKAAMVLTLIATLPSGWFFIARSERQREYWRVKRESEETELRKKALADEVSSLVDSVLGQVKGARGES